MVTAIFPAAGQGKRMNTKVNKIFLQLLGKPVLVHTLLAFSRCEMIDELIICVAPEEVRVVETLLRAVPKLKPWRVVEGGSQRQYSIANALRVLDAETDIVLVHDAARPLIQSEVIENVIETVRMGNSAVTAVPEKNTIKIVDDEKLIQGTPERSTLWSIQTPQGFMKDVIVEAYDKAEEDNFLGTDDASLVERLGLPVKVVEGNYSNIKITTPEDMIVAEAFLRQGVISDVVEKAADFVSGATEFLKKGLKRD